MASPLKFEMNKTFVQAGRLVCESQILYFTQRLLNRKALLVACNR
jgi:hypothetical protein